MKPLSLKEKTDKLKTEENIELIKTTFQKILEKKLNLIKVSTPLIVREGTGINDDLNGIEKPVNFSMKHIKNFNAEIVQSLAKWKRIRLAELGIEYEKGIYTDMKALRPHEKISPLHSIYVDQWDWEKHIKKEQRTLHYLKTTVRQIYDTIKETMKIEHINLSLKSEILPEEITFIHSEKLLEEYPELTSKEREYVITKKHKAVFIIGIGAKLINGYPHDERAPDYDDWTTPTLNGYKGLNGDIIFWHNKLKCPLEISSMGIRVDKISLHNQLSINNCLERKKLLFHKLLLNGKLPYSMGGGIGQSRLCMFLLQKAHIGEVQVGIWPKTLRKSYSKNGVFLL